MLVNFKLARHDSIHSQRHTSRSKVKQSQRTCMKLRIGRLCHGWTWSCDDTFFLGTQVHTVFCVVPYSIHLRNEFIPKWGVQLLSFRCPWRWQRVFLFPAASASSFSSSRPRRRPKSSICSRTVRPGVSSLSSQSCVSCFSPSLQHLLDLKNHQQQQLFELLIGCSILFNEVSVAAPAGNSQPLQSLGARMPSADHPKMPRNKNTQLIKYFRMGHELARKLSQIFYDPFWRLLAACPCVEPLRGKAPAYSFLATPKGSNGFYAPCFR